MLAAKNPLRRWWRGCKRFNQGEALEADCLKISLQSTLRQLHREVLYYCRGTVNYWNLPVHAFDRELSGGRVRGWRGGVSAGRGGRVWPNPSSLLHRRRGNLLRSVPSSFLGRNFEFSFFVFISHEFMLHLGYIWWKKLSSSLKTFFYPFCANFRRSHVRTWDLRFPQIYMI